MAYAIIVNEANSQTTGDATSHTITIPTGSVGQLVLVFTTFDGTPTTTWPSGWTQLYSVGASTIRRECRYRWLDGTEGATISVTTSASEEMQARAIVLDRAHPTAAPEATTDSGTSTTPNPPSLAPSWSQRETLWIASAHVDTAQTASAYPTNFIYNQSTANSGGTTGVTFAQAVRYQNVATQDPGTFTIGTSSFWATSTVGIRPDYRPAAAWSYAQTSGTLTMTFTDASTSIPAATYSWTFGDGGTSTSASPSRTYALPGVYTVSLTITNAEGSSTLTRTITVVPIADTPPARADGLTIEGAMLVNGMWRDLSCMILDASWTWGAGSDQGVLTTQDAGTLQVRFFDPDRELDPQNAVGPFYGVLDIGTEFRMRINSNTCFRGRITSLAHELGLGDGIDFVTLTAEDNLASLGRFAADVGGGFSAASQTTSARITALADRLSWPAGLRDIGTGGETLQAETINDDVWPAMVDAVTSDGGRLQVEQDGTLHYRNRATAWASSATTLTLGCGGSVELEALALVTDTGALMNSLTAEIVGGTGATVTTDATSIAKYGTWTGTKTDLKLTTGSARTTWAGFVVGAQKYPAYGARSATFTLTPALAGTVCTALMGDRWRVLETHHGPNVDATQRLLSLAYVVGPTRVTVTATMGTDYGLVQTAYRQVWDTEADWETASAYGSSNINGNSGQLQVEDRIV